MGFFSSVKKAVKSVGSSVKNAVKSTASSVKSAVKSTVTSVKEHAQKFKEDVLNTNTLVSTVGGAISGFVSGGIPGAIAGAAAGVYEGREATLAERRGDSGEDYAEEYTVTDNGITIGSGIIDNRTSSEAINGVLDQLKGAVESSLTPSQRYRIYTNALDKSGNRSI